MNDGNGRNNNYGQHFLSIPQKNIIFLYRLSDKICPGVSNLGAIIIQKPVNMTQKSEA